METALDGARGQQVADELAALARRLRECAAAMATTD